MISVFEDTTGNRFNGIIRGVILEGRLIVEIDQQGLQTFQPKELKYFFKVLLNWRIVYR